ncbi:MAG: DNA-methyltransferase [Candidatus Thorarchaeota archaeon]
MFEREDYEFILSDNVAYMKTLDSDSIDLTVTSPPYGTLRDYGGHSWDINTIAPELYRVTKEEGVVCWNTADGIVDRGESLDSFRNVLVLTGAGFKLHQTLIYAKVGVGTMLSPTAQRYHRTHEYVFILKKGDRLRAFNPIRDRKTHYKNVRRKPESKKFRRADGKLHDVGSPYVSKPYSLRYSWWPISTGYMKSSKDPLAFEHPAIMPEKLVHGLIQSYSNRGDIVLDPFLGSGTTAIEALSLKRKAIGIEAHEDYYHLAHRRMKKALNVKIFKKDLNEFI